MTDVLFVISLAHGFFSVRSIGATYLAIILICIDVYRYFFHFMRLFGRLRVKQLC